MPNLYEELKAKAKETIKDLKLKGKKPEEFSLTQHTRLVGWPVLVLEEWDDEESAGNSKIVLTDAPGTFYKLEAHDYTDKEQVPYMGYKGANFVRLSVPCTKQLLQKHTRELLEGLERLSK